MEHLDISRLVAMGYCVTSRKFCHVTRIDRPDWRERMAKDRSPWDLREGLEWVTRLGSGAEDHYRRVYSRDTVVVDATLLRNFPRSDWTVTGYRAKG